jgi:hypothetical protein
MRPTPTLSKTRTLSTLGRNFGFQKHERGASMRRDRVIHLLAIFLVIGLVVGCSQSPSSDSTKVKVADVDVGRSISPDKTIAEKTDSFRPSDTFYISVRAEGSAPNATVKARWLFQNSQLVNESETTIVPQGSAVTEFHISKPDPWPVGEYKVEVSINGAPPVSKTFKVI